MTTAHSQRVLYLLCVIQDCVKVSIHGGSTSQLLTQQVLAVLGQVEGTHAILPLISMSDPECSSALLCGVELNATWKVTMKHLLHSPARQVTIKHRLETV